MKLWELIKMNKRKEEAVHTEISLEVVYFGFKEGELNPPWKVCILP